MLGEFLNRICLPKKFERFLKLLCLLETAFAEFIAKRLSFALWRLFIAFLLSFVLARGFERVPVNDLPRL
jgi:hypothetical protein